MRWVNDSLKTILCLIVILSSALLPSALSADVIDLSPGVADVSKDFSDKFCVEIFGGASPEIAGENAAKKMARGIMLSPVLKEIMSSPRDELALSLSKNIYDECGNELSFNQVELDDYLKEILSKAPGPAKENIAARNPRDPLSQLKIG